MPAKYIFFTGGVVSSVGKGVTAAAIGRCLRTRLQGRGPETGPVHQRRPGHDDPRTSTAKSTCWMTAPKRTWTWATTNVSSTSA